MGSHSARLDTPLRAVDFFQGAEGPILDVIDSLAAHNDECFSP